METDYYAVLGVEPEGETQGENDSTDTGSNETDVENAEEGNTSSTADAVPLPTSHQPQKGSFPSDEEKQAKNGDAPLSTKTQAFLLKRTSSEEGKKLPNRKLMQNGAWEDEGEGIEEDEAEKPSEVGGETPHPSADADTFPSEGKADVVSTPMDGAKQSPEENARYAAARRKAEAERDAAVARAREEAKQYAENAVAELLKKADFTNPYTGQKIRTMAEFDAYDAQKRQEEDKAFVQSTGMTDEQFKAYMAERPEVQEAKRTKAQAEEVLRQVREREAKAKLDGQVKEISALNPAVKSLEDITKLEAYPEIYEKVKRGYSLVDAYKLTNMAELESRAVARAQQQARNAERTKAHLVTTESRGEGSVEVPADVKAEYRALNPGITDAEIQKHYASYAKR